MKDLEKEINKFIKKADTKLMVNPQTLKELKDRGLPIKSEDISEDDYIEKLFTNKQEKAKDLLQKFPFLDQHIANPTIGTLYDEILECFVLGITGASITLSCILLELAIKYRLWDERIELDPNSPWDHIELLDFTKTVNALRRLKVISKEEKEELDYFNVNIRNLYVHYNIKKLIRGVSVTKLLVMDTKTGKVKELENVRAVDKHFLWFEAKKKVDEAVFIENVSFCIKWTNKISKKIM